MRLVTCAADSPPTATSEPAYASTHDPRRFIATTSLARTLARIGGPHRNGVLLAVSTSAVQRHRGPVREELRGAGRDLAAREAQADDRVGSARARFLEHAVERFLAR